MPKKMKHNPLYMYLLCVLLIRLEHNKVQNVLNDGIYAWLLVDAYNLTGNFLHIPGAIFNYISYGYRVQ